MKEKIKKNLIWSIIFLSLSFIFLIFTNLIYSPSIGYLVGKLISQIGIWFVIIGIIAYVVWRFGFHKNKSLLFIFSLLFFVTAMFTSATNIMERYAISRLQDSFNKVPEEEVENKTYYSVIDEEWEDFYSEIGQFKASFPTYPEHEIYDVPLFDTGLVGRLDEYVTEKTDNTTFIIFVGTYPPEIDISKPEFGLEAGVNNAVESFEGNRLISSHFTTFNEYHAIDYLIQNKGLDVYVKGKIFMKGQNRYQLLYTYGSGDYRESDHNRFINSFELLK